MLVTRDFTHALICGRPKIMIPHIGVKLGQAMIEFPADMHG